MKSRLLISAAFTAAMATSVGVPAFAQEEAAQTAPAVTTPDTIVITGSFIRGTPEDAALPVDVFSTDELSQSGVTSPLEFIKQLPSVGSVLGDSNQFSPAAQGSQGQGSINLRGLGPTRTLVLLNSKRTVQAPGDGFTDTNLIPLFALERVEILKDGAASTYGSDAIAGVANFLTRTDFDGIELEGDWTFIDGSDDNYKASLLVGKNFDGGNIMIGGGWQHRSELPTTARDFVFPGYEDNFSGYSALATPGLFAVTYLQGIDAGTGAPILDTRVVRDAGCEELGGTVTPPLCRFTYVPHDNLIEDEDRYQAFASMNAELGSGLTVKVEGLYARTDVESLNYSPSFPPTQGPNGSGFQNAFTISPANPYVGDFLDNVGLPQSGTTNGPIAAVTAVFYRPLGFLGNPLDPDRGAGTGFAKTEGLRFSGDLEYEMSDTLLLTLSATWWRSQRDNAVRDIVGTRLQNALNGLGGADCDPATGTPGQGSCVYFNPFTTAGASNPAWDLPNPFYVGGAENSPALIDYLQPYNGTRQSEEQTIVQAVLTGESGIELAGGPLAFAVGAQYRENDFRNRSWSNISDAQFNPCFVEGDVSCVGSPTEGVGPFIFLGVSRPQNLEQEVFAGFAEVNVPLADTLELTGALRYEDYGDPVGSTLNPKGSFRWEPLEFLTFRGSIGTTFRGPLASNVDPNFVTALAGLAAAGGNYKSVDIFGNPNLDPETALTYNVGAIVSTGGLTVSADFWTYEFEDQITRVPEDAIASSVVPVAGGPANCDAPLADLVTFDGGQCIQGTSTGLNIARVRSDVVNGPDVTVRGFDFAVNYDIDAGLGVFSLGGNATWNLEYKIDDFVVDGVLLQESYDAVGFGNYFRDPDTLPEWRVNAYVNFNYDARLNARYVFNYIDGVTDERCTAAGCVNTNTRFGEESGSYVRQDFVLTYDLLVGGADLQFQAAVNNIFDEDPPEAALPVSYNPFLGDAYGRHYQLGLKANF
ncbi:TonB-dependent receptor [Pacificimonas flava]|uniref:TonB-dependent receptor n=2 Tax=Pacificimonas TaxID=1960290 RepID=A0A219B0V6_9SPHN|nr:MULTISPECIES: TonB-dependent receptor [Pacificimonas]MBZ6379694.1 TonB-dependent receptor [Pacificimonas aurantium]OWV31844.1 TonB-dependent receptor [Pacificimonas flava]